MNTRAERIEEYKAELDAEIDRLRDLRENEQDVERWLELDEQIDALLVKKDNAAAEIEAALMVEREIAPKTARFQDGMEDYLDLKRTEEDARF